MYLLDTNIVSYSLYHPDSHPHLVHKIKTVKQSLLYVSMVTLTELTNRRIQALVRNQKNPKSVKYYSYVESVLKDIQNMQWVSYGEAEYREFVKIPASVRCGVHDKQIAATAITHNFILVTANVRDFKGIPKLRVEDWTARPLESSG